MHRSSLLRQCSLASRLGFAFVIFPFGGERHLLFMELHICNCLEPKRRVVHIQRCGASALNRQPPAVGVFIIVHPSGTPSYLCASFSCSACFNRRASFSFLSEAASSASIFFCWAACSFACLFRHRMRPALPPVAPAPFWQKGS